MNNIEHNIEAAALTARERLATLRRAQNAVLAAEAAYAEAIAALDALEGAAHALRERQRNAR